MKNNNYTLKSGWGEEAAEDVIHVAQGYYTCLVKINGKCKFRVNTNVDFALRKMLDA